MDPGHVAEQLKQQAMQAGVVVFVALDQVEQAGEGGFDLHHLKDGFVAAAVVEQDGGDDMQDGSIFLLQRAVNKEGRRHMSGQGGIAPVAGSRQIGGAHSPCSE